MGSRKSYITRTRLMSAVRSGCCTCTRVSTAEHTQPSLEYNREREHELVFEHVRCGSREFGLSCGSTGASL